MNCPKCNQEIVDSAAVCKHCGEELGTAKRPKGVTVLGVLVLIGAIFSLFGLKQPTPVLLGITIPVWFFVLLSLIFIGLAIFCGIGLLKQVKQARVIYIYMGIFGVVNQIATCIWTASGNNFLKLMQVQLTKQGVSITYQQFEAIKQGVIIGGIIGALLNGWILYYLFRKKDFFTKDISIIIPPSALQKLNSIFAPCKENAVKMYSKAKTSMPAKIEINIVKNDPRNDSDAKDK